VPVDRRRLYAGAGLGNRPASPADAKTLSRAGIAGWAARLGSPGPEDPFSRRMAHLGGVVAVAVLILYLLWRVMFTMPAGGSNLMMAWILVGFEALPLGGLVLKVVSLWNINSRPPLPVTEAPGGMRVAVLIPTYNEPVEVLAPTIAAACALEPAHETWVLDDGDRAWVAQMCAAFGARYVRRDVHDHAKAGNMNHALGLMAAEEDEGADGIDIIGRVGLRPRALTGLPDRDSWLVQRREGGPGSGPAVVL